MAARGGVEVTTAEEEPVGLIGRVLAGSGVGEAIGAVVGGGGEGREEGVEVGSIGGVGSEEGGVLAIMKYIIWCRLRTSSIDTEKIEEEEKRVGDGEARLHGSLMIARASEIGEQL